MHNHAEFSSHSCLIRKPYQRIRHCGAHPKAVHGQETKLVVLSNYSQLTTHTPILNSQSSDGDLTQK